jgi:hypothetical protein
MLLDSGLRRNDGGKFTGVFVWFTLRTASCAFKAQALKSSLRRNDIEDFSMTRTNPEKQRHSGRSSAQTRNH